MVSRGIAREGSGDFLQAEPSLQRFGWSAEDNTLILMTESPVRLEGDETFVTDEDYSHVTDGDYQRLLDYRHYRLGLPSTSVSRLHVACIKRAASHAYRTCTPL